MSDPNRHRPDAPRPPPHEPPADTDAGRRPQHAEPVVPHTGSRYSGAQPGDFGGEYCRDPAADAPDHTREIDSRKLGTGDQRGVADPWSGRGHADADEGARRLRATPEMASPRKRGGLWAWLRGRRPRGER